MTMEPIDRLLAEASAPAHADEVAGLAAALTVFNQLAPRPRRNPVLSFLAKLVAAKAIAIGAAAALGGVALAAAAGVLPAPAQNFAHDALKAPAADSSTHPAAQASDHPSPSASPSPNLIGLCRAYGAGVGDAKGKAASNPAFTALVTAAGSEEAVPAYCTTALASAPGGKPTALPTQAQGHQPSSHPTGPPATHPTGPPATHPTGPPATHPTGPPATHPTGPPAPTQP
jgi:hypothetical protein